MAAAIGPGVCCRPAVISVHSLLIARAASAGAMVYVCLHELLVESVEQLGVTKATLAQGSVEGAT